MESLSPVVKNLDPLFSLFLLVVFHQRLGIIAFIANGRTDLSHGLALSGDLFLEPFFLLPVLLCRLLAHAYLFQYQVQVQLIPFFFLQYVAINRPESNLLGRDLFPHGPLIVNYRPVIAIHKNIGKFLLG